MMTNKDVEKQQEKYEEEIKRHINENRVLFENEVVEGHYTDCLKLEKIISDDLCGLTAQETLKAVISFNNEVGDVGFCFNGVEDKIENSDWEGEVSEFYFVYKYYVNLELTDKEIEERAKAKAKEYLSQALKPSSETYTRRMDCKLFQLFMSGNIDFVTLQSLVHSNCKI